MFDATIIESAVLEAVALRGVSVSAVPPADLRNPATSVIGTALSKELRDAGATVITTDALFDEGMERAWDRLGSAVTQDVFMDLEDALWEQTGEARDSLPIEPTPEDLASPLGEARAAAVRALQATVLVTRDPALLQHTLLDGVAVVSPGKWLDEADSLVRQFRQGIPPADGGRATHRTAGP